MTTVLHASGVSAAGEEPFKTKSLKLGCKIKDKLQGKINTNSLELKIKGIFVRYNRYYFLVI